MLNFYTYPLTTAKTIWLIINNLNQKEFDQKVAHKEYSFGETFTSC